MHPTYAQLLNARGTIDKLAQTGLPSSVSLRLARSIRKVYYALEYLEGERAKILPKYVELDADGELRKNEEGEYIWLDKEGFKVAMEDIVELEIVEDISPLNAKQIPNHIEFTPLESLQLAEAGLIKN